MAADTIPQLLLHSARRYNKQSAFKFKQGNAYLNSSHAEVLERVHKAALGLSMLALAKGDRIALLSENRLEWAISDLAILSMGGINVPIYATLPANQIEYILRDSEARAVFVSDAVQMKKIEEIRPNLPMLNTVIIFDPDGTSGDTLTLDGLIEKGSSSTDPPGLEQMIATISSSDWASIIYTSGTTGDPKGVILTHSNFISNALTCAAIIKIGPNDTCLSFLPLSHVLERTAGYYTMLYAGVTIAYAESIDAVPQNLLEICPTVMISVPRLYEKMYARIMETATSGSAVKKNLFFWAVKVGKIFVNEKLAGKISSLTKFKYAVANKLVFSKLKGKTGGRLRFFVSGGAPLARDIAEFFYAAGLPVLEGYGLTETSPVLAVNTFEQFKFGTVGRAIDGVELKIARDGEILAKGPNIMAGYFKKPDRTSEAIKDGWFHTGDIGEIDNEGFLSITDRKKDIIVTSAGKNIAPQPIENSLKTSKYIAEVVLIGNRRNFISAVIVPNFENLIRFANAAGISYNDLAELVKNEKVASKIHKEIDRKSEGFAGFERIKKILLLDKDFSLEMNELTPTLKVKRSIVEQKYKSQIDELYSE